MTYKTYNCNNFNVYTIKTDKFKTCHMEIIFSKNMEAETISEDNFLGDILTENTKKYTSKDLIIHLEELYKTIFYSVTSKIGNMLNTSFILDFIDPFYIDEPDYLEKVLQLPFEALENPNVTNSEFDLKTFNVIKEKIKKDIMAVKENPVKETFQKAFKYMDKDSKTAIRIAGSLEDLEKITPASLYKRYQRFFKDHICNIFIIGNLDMDRTVTLIKKYFHNRIINNYQFDLYVENKMRKKALEAQEKGNFIQSNLAMIYNLDKLNKKEKDLIFHVYNFILGNGGLTSKLYQSLREENSLCYNLSSMYLKYDNLLAIYVSLDKDNIPKAIKLTKKCLKSMVKGEFSEEDLIDAKKNLALTLDYSLDNNISLLNNYIFNIIDDLPPLEKRKEMLDSITKEDVMNIAKKIKLNTIFTLIGGNNEGN